MKLKLDQYNRATFWCPGCKQSHTISIPPDKHAWRWNNDIDNPTIEPSILTHGTYRLTEEQYQAIRRGEHIESVKYSCHSYVTNGKIQFLGDCTHDLKNQTVDLPEWLDQQDT